MSSVLLAPVKVYVLKTCSRKAKNLRKFYFNGMLKKLKKYSFSKKLKTPAVVKYHQKGGLDKKISFHWSTGLHDCTVVSKNRVVLDSTKWPRLDGGKTWWLKLSLFFPGCLFYPRLNGEKR